MRGDVCMSMEQPSLVVLASHYALVESAVTGQLGPLAGWVVRQLSQRGDMTLREIADALRTDPFQARTTTLEAARATESGLALSGAGTTVEPSLVTDAALKEVVTRLLLHRVVQASASQPTYRLQLGSALLLHVLYPLWALCCRRRYGVAAEALLLVVRQLAAVPMEAAINLASEREGPAHGQQERIRAAARILCAEGWLEDLSSPSGAQAPRPGGKRRRDGEGEDNATLSAGPHRLCLPAVVRAMLEEALDQWVCEHYHDGGLSAAVVATLLQSAFDSAMAAGPDAAKGETAVDGRAPDSSDDGTNLLGFPRLALASSSPLHSAAGVHVALTARAAHRQGTRLLPAVGEEAVLAALRQLSVRSSSSSSLTRGPLVVSSAASRGRHGAETAAELFSLNVAAAIAVLQEACCERVVFTRHGVLGVRFVKLLLRQHFLEDRVLAEEAVATQPRTRETLHAMLRDGYVQQQEVPRGAITGDRQPKTSVFLWGCSLQASLLPSARAHVAAALRQASTALLQEMRGPMSGGGGDLAGGTTAPALEALLTQAGADGRQATASALRQAVREQRNVMGVQSCVHALMRLLLVLDYF